MDNTDQSYSKGFKIINNDASVPTTQVNLNNTVGVTLLVSKDTLDTTDSDVSVGNNRNENIIYSTSQLASMKSVNSLRNLSNQIDNAEFGNSRNVVTSNTTTKNNGYKNVISEYEDDSFQNANNSTNNFTNNDETFDSTEYNFDDSNNNNNTLFNLLQESIYSYVPSINGSYNRSIVGNELPEIFKNDSNNDIDKDNSSIEEQDIVIDNIAHLDIDSDTDTKTDFDKIDKNFFILSNAGKPIFTHFGQESQITTLSGIINTIINFFQLNENENIKCINMGSQFGKIVFLNKDPIILMAYSSRKENKINLQNQLEFLYGYLLSSLTSKQLNRLFNKRSNFDLRTFLSDEHFDNLSEICNTISNRLYPDILINALPSQFMRKNVRKKVHNLILDCLNIDSYAIPRGTILYGLILSTEQTKLISVLRPKGHTLHTNDLQLLFCLIRQHLKKQRENDSKANDNYSIEKELWLPICFPKFNSTGFLYSYIKFIPNDNKTCIVLISAQKDAFFKLKLFADRLWEKLIQKKLDRYINGSINTGFKMRDISAPLIHHFIYKSKKHVQYVMPELEFNINSEDNLLKQFDYEKKLQKYYKQLYDSVIMDDGIPLSKTILNIIHWENINKNKHDQNDSLNTIILQNRNNSGINSLFLNEKIDLMGLVWITPSFELYLLTNNGVHSKDVIMRSAKKILNWCKYNESRLFIDQGAMF